MIRSEPQRQETVHTTRRTAKVIVKRCSVRVHAKTGLLNKFGQFCQFENRISRLRENKQNYLIS